MQLTQWVGLAFWVIALYLFRPRILHRPEWRQPRGLMLRLFMVNFALSLTLQIDPLAVSFDRAVGINNLSWLLGYLFCVAGSYCGLTLWVWLRGGTFPRRSAIFALITARLLVLFFPFLTENQEFLRTAIPSTYAQLFFWTLMSLFYVLMAREGERIVNDFLPNEQLPSGRVRLGLTLASFQAVRIFAVLRALAASSVLFDPLQPFARPALILGDLSISACIVCIVLGSSPIKWLQVGARLWIYLEQQQTCHALDRLRAQLVRVSAPIPWTAPSLRERLLQPSFALYCYLIDILDRRSLLLERIHRDRAIPLPRGLMLLLEELPPTEDWVELLQYVRTTAHGSVPVH